MGKEKQAEHQFYYISHLTTDNRMDRKSKICISSPFYFPDKAT